MTEKTEWIRGIPIGRGSFSTVNLAIPKSAERPMMVVKSADVSTSESLVNEREVLRRLGGRCRQIVQCFGDEATTENGRRLYNLFFEYASGGSLDDHLRRRQRLPEAEVRRHTCSILKGLEHIHGSGFAHCDIKLQNILLFEDNEVKVSDFGLARERGPREPEVREGRNKRRRFELRGTPMYMSPEIVAGDGDGDKDPSPADVWAVGCAVVEMLTGSPAWECDPGCGVPELLCRIGAGDSSPAIPEKLSEDGRDFLKKCFIKDPKERWTARTLLDHAFVSGSGLFPDTASSPRGPFEFAETTPSSCSSSGACYSGEYADGARDSGLKRVGELAGEPGLGPDWSGSEGWVTVR